jgi:hypothetical protein
MDQLQILRKRRNPSVGRKATIAVLILAVVAQIAVLWVQEIEPMGANIWSLRGRSAIERSAEIAFGSNFAGFMAFLQERIPDQALVVLPPMDQEPVFGNVALMQYFLFPREVVNCPSGEALHGCVRSMRGGQSYLIAVGDFPPAEDVPREKTRIRYGESRGLYAPFH